MCNGGLRSQILQVIVLVAFAASVGATEKKGFTTAQICKAGIGIVMGRAPAIMKIDRVDFDVVYLSYVRADDRTRWTYKCQLKGQEILWGADDGRWRTHPADSVITFAVEGLSLTVTERFSDGSSNRKTFTRQQLGR
jgi:hypothetical protein